MGWAGSRSNPPNEVKVAGCLAVNQLISNARTLENWEQGRTRPNAQAAIRLVERYPDTVERLAMI